MMVLFFFHDRSDGRHCVRIDIAQNLKLVGQVFKHHTFNRDGGGKNGFTAAEASDQSQRQAAHPAQPVTAAAGIVATLQFREEDGPVTALVGKKLPELTHHIREEKPGHGQLTAVDTDRAMLTCMVNLHHAIAEVCFVRQDVWCIHNGLALFEWMGF
ncbi:hypothetical protein SAMN03159443_01575 [Pseudomonas sp. NFACC15-1]|nr:hypothetical protein SAMN03159443_01575 [Pseudomonas sp. NFACC15-1]SDX85563.1 hypothetical protein SAMN03159380_03003 [Pseudomonas sp. NFACC14]